MKRFGRHKLDCPCIICKRVRGEQADGQLTQDLSVSTPAGLLKVKYGNRGNSAAKVVKVRKKRAQVVNQPIDLREIIRNLIQEELHKAIYGN